MCSGKQLCAMDGEYGAMKIEYICHGRRIYTVEGGYVLLEALCYERQFVVSKRHVCMLAIMADMARGGFDRTTKHIYPRGAENFLLAATKYGGRWNKWANTGIRMSFIQFWGKLGCIAICRCGF